MWFSGEGDSSGAVPAREPGKRHGWVEEAIMDCGSCDECPEDNAHSYWSLRGRLVLMEVWVRSTWQSI